MIFVVVKSCDMGEMNSWEMEIGELIGVGVKNDIFQFFAQ